MKPPKDLIDAIQKNNSFLILTHTTPDGDAFGSAIALKFLLEQLGKKAEIYAEPAPQQYQFLPGIGLIKNIENLQSSILKPVLILVDCNTVARISYKKEIIETINASTFSTKLIIDHHIETNKTVDASSIKWIEPEAAATGIMIYYLIKSLNGKITPQIATNLYTAIIVDTGNFQFDNTNEEVFQIASELVICGAKPSYIYQNSFESWSENRFKLFIKMLNRVELIPPVAIAFISKEDFEETETSEPDTERFVEFLRILKDVKAAVLFREMEKNFIKVSLRSKGDVDVSRIAIEFGGGGHKNAAGFRIKTSFEEARRQLIEKLKIYNVLSGDLDFKV
ncbi:bifunctional oligoribonuclease/PAP phosphatase NrnA [Thermodesulfovibrio sp. 3907-1M]|uniref:Bifunctional oligoribonuclease/PAP phosphatase NrnA n=1 Tax=Thermodesulfovibrio autotrophicus TaxID=3118333 RepID=A0AAU8GUM5_9BACT